MSASGVITPPYVAAPLRLEPFRGLMLTPTRVGDPASARAFARPYRTVTARLAQWERRGFLTRDRAPAVYLHEYTADGITVRGLVGGLDVSRRAARADESAVYPHESIIAAQADELAARMLEMHLNPAPILLVHHGTPDSREIISQTMATRPDHQYTDRASQRHRLWAIRDAARLTRLGDALAQTKALIADGHHRYAAYLRLQQQAPGGTHDQGLAMLIDHEDTPLFLGAIHRELRGTGIDRLLRAAAAAGARCQDVDARAGMASLGQNTLVTTDGPRWATIELPDIPGESAVEILHRRILPDLLDQGVGVRHHHSAEDALNRARPDRAIAVLMPAPHVDTILATSIAGRLIPEKTTSFQPKPSLGVLLRSLAD